MSPTKRNLPIAAWSEGDSVEGFALLRRKERRQDKNGNDFLDMELTDASGSIGAKVWSGSAALEREFEALDFVAYKGNVKSYREQLQLSINDCRRATDDDRQHGFDEGLLIPSTDEDLDDLRARLESVLGSVERPPLRSLAAVTLERHGKALREHPAAKLMHHAYRGGLLEHVVSMIELGDKVCDHYDHLDRDLVLVGILFHDLGKLLELGAMPANEYTLAGRLVGHVVLGRDLLRDCCAAVDDFPADLELMLEHIVLSHQGLLEYGSPVEPKTAEALAVHFVDDLDSKLNQLQRAKKSGAGLQYLRGLGRHVYLGEDPRGEEQEPAATELPESAAPAQVKLDL